MAPCIAAPIATLKSGSTPSSGILINSVSIDLIIGILVGPPIGITRSISADFKFASLRTRFVSAYSPAYRIGQTIIYLNHVCHQTPIGFSSNLYIDQVGRFQ